MMRLLLGTALVLAVYGVMEPMVAVDLVLDGLDWLRAAVRNM